MQALRRVVAASLLILFLLTSAHSQVPKPFGGRVFDAQTHRGIPNLEVRLRPPRGSTSTTMIGSTDQNGVFRFSNVRAGRYLLEVFQGPYVLYRAETDTSVVNNVDIPIQRR